MNTSRTKSKLIGVAIAAAVGIFMIAGVSSAEDTHACTGCCGHAEKASQSEATYQAPEEFKAQLSGVLAGYLNVQKALAGDDLEAAKKGADGTMKALSKVDMKLLEGEAHMKWMKSLKALQEHAGKISAAGDIKTARAEFKPLSDAMIEVIACFGASGKAPVYRIHCPMAFEHKGADWLQADKETRNPYYGSSMLKCGDLVETMSPAGDKGSEAKGSENKGAGEHQHE